LTLEELTQIAKDYAAGYHYLIEPYTLTLEERRARLANKHRAEESGWHIDIYTLKGTEPDQIETLYITPAQEIGKVRWLVAIAVQKIQRRTQQNTVTPYLRLIKS
jgi:hypothetical protein